MKNFDTGFMEKHLTSLRIFDPGSSQRTPRQSLRSNKVSSHVTERKHDSKVLPKDIKRNNVGTF